LLIGKRTSGGSVGIKDHGPLLDGGMVVVPEFGNADPQLERALKELLEVLSKNPGGLPPPPVPPVKTQAR